MEMASDSGRAQPSTVTSALPSRRAAFPPGFPLWLRIAFWACIVIAVAVVFRRAAALLLPPSTSAPPQLASLDAWFVSHNALTWTHILCAVAFVALLPFLFWARTSGSRAVERGFFVLGFTVAATAYAMSVYAVGGWLERSAVWFFNTLFVISMVQASLALRRADAYAARRWILRAVAILLGIATTRPVMGVFFATAPLTHLTPRQFFGIAFWIGFSLNTVVMELWLRSSAAKRRGFLMA
jgi:uncharacterized membrane protein YsdA (DUF1294 family)